MHVYSPCLLDLEACFEGVDETPEWGTALCSVPEGTPPPGG